MYLHEIDHVSLACIFAVSSFWIFIAELECWTEVLKYHSPVHDSVGLHGRLSWLRSGIGALAVFSVESYVLFDSLDIEERLSSQEGRVVD